MLHDVVGQLLEHDGLLVLHRGVGFRLLLGIHGVGSQGDAVLDGFSHNSNRFKVKQKVNYRLRSGHHEPPH